MRFKTVVPAVSLGALALGGVVTAALSAPSDQAIDRRAPQAAAAQPAASQAAAAATAHEKPSHTNTPVGPDGTGPAAYGLCQAFAGKATDAPATGSTAYRNLAAAAGGADRIEAYCAGITRPGSANAAKPAKPAQAARPTQAAKPERSAPGRPESPGANGRARR